MTIPESQLETWSNQGATVTAQNTHKSIRLALNADTSSLKKKGFIEGRDFEIYLQGSYKNTTNIRGDSDVDVVIQLNRVFEAEISECSTAEQMLYRQMFPYSNYHWGNWRSDVLESLQAYYGWNNINDTGNKSLKLKKGSGRLAADIVPCLQYRRYCRFRSIVDPFVEGVNFYTRRENRPVINYPKLHYENGSVKNSVNHANGWYKPVVRMFKNARYYLISQRLISKDLAPSYFLECLLYNVPNDRFRASFQLSYLEVLVWLSKSLQGASSSFICQNEQMPLFGNTPEQWSIVNAQELISALSLLWSEW